MATKITNHDHVSVGYCYRQKSGLVAEQPDHNDMAMEVVQWLELQVPRVQ